MKEKLSFEQAMDRLEEIVAALENGQAPLDEMMKLYEEGAKLTGMCAAKLEKAKLKVRQLNGEESRKELSVEKAGGEQK